MTISLHRFLIGFAEGVIVAAAAFALCVNYANAAEFFPTKEAAKAAAHGKHIAWICEGKDRLYYVGRAGEQHCEANRHDRSIVRSELPRPVDHNRSAGVRAVQQAREVIVPTKVKTVAATAPAETTGVAARAMPVSWADQFDPLFQGREERAQLIPAVLRIQEPKPIAATMVLHSSRGMTAWDWGYAALWALFLFGSVTGVPFLVGDALKLLRTREMW